MNRVVLVTGGARGIGKEIALTFAKMGDSVIIADVLEDEGKMVERQLKAYHADSSFYVCNLLNQHEMDHLIQYIKTQYGRLNILINNAGLSQFKPLDDITFDEYDNILSVNLKAPFYLSKQFYLMNKGCSYGRIINIASTRYLMSEPSSEAYASSKGGIVSLTHALALSLSHENITVNSISPGWIETNDYEHLTEQDHKQHPSGRVGKPSDIANCCIYLAEQQNDFINGQNIIIDGGMTKKMIYES